MGVGIDTGSKAQQDLLSNALPGGFRIDGIQLISIIAALTAVYNSPGETPPAPSNGDKYKKCPLQINAEGIFLLG